MSFRLSDYWRQFFDLPLRHGGYPFAYFLENQLPVATASPTSTVPALASQLIQSFFGQSESGTTPSLLLRSPMAFLQTNYGLLLRDCRLWHHGALLTLVLLRQLHRFPWNSYLPTKAKNPVEHLNRCKTSICLYCQQMQGVPEALVRPALTKTLISCLWHRWGRSSTYLLFKIYCDGTRLSQAPCLLFRFYTVVALRDFLWRHFKLRSRGIFTDMAKG